MVLRGNEVHTNIHQLTNNSTHTAVLGAIFSSKIPIVRTTFQKTETAPMTLYSCALRWKNGFLINMEQTQISTLFLINSNQQVQTLKTFFPVPQVTSFVVVELTIFLAHFPNLESSNISSKLDPLWEKKISNICTGDNQYVVFIESPPGAGKTHLMEELMEGGILQPYHAITLTDENKREEEKNEMPQSRL